MPRRLKAGRYTENRFSNWCSQLISQYLQLLERAYSDVIWENNTKITSELSVNTYDQVCIQIFGYFTRNWSFPRK